MTVNGILQIAIYLIVLLLLVKPLGGYMARVYQGERTVLGRALGPVERLTYRLIGVNPEQEMGWKTYAVAVLVFSVFGMLFLYALQRLQGILPLNPEGLGDVSADSALNTAISFVSNTNWQGYGGETTMSYLTQMLGMTVQNFASAAAGMAILIAFIRGLVRHSTSTVGNFWVDLTRSVLYILLPLALVVAVMLVGLGVVQSFSPYQTATLVQPTVDATGNQVTEQTLAIGPAASQIAIKQLGTNGGGFFNTNSAHPFENPTPLTNFLEMLSILLIPAALCYTFGKMVNDTRQGWALLAAMLIMLVVFGVAAYAAEGAGNPRLTALGIDQAATNLLPGGNMEGKELRFGIPNSALWATITTAASNGSVNSMHDSFTPLGGLVPLVMMQFGEVVFGGVGSGLYGMLAFVIVAVFVAGLMVGRTPEYLGKKIESYEIKMAALLILIMPVTVLGLTALAVVTGPGKASVFNPGPHGFSEVLYGFTSMGNNNGSAFTGLGANTPFYNLFGALAMLIARFWLIVPTLALAGSLVRKKRVPTTAGTLPTHTPLFIGWLIVIVLIVGALNFLPALALGPIVEHLGL
ncbi:MAG: potassium-transporting ATPase subunit KdpA [Anaerolineae bacterium]|nr:potassium-transporting ATPase subunit KdpA [Anaerolineae bacterium]MCB0229053.1 potassium-transporting ATPase subunit KdpA [Anaerolineae bacterium]MCB0232802.1 potassium-transporting ATPase subunit KdpA [Anaerolineae bacterium]MCB0239436.1 potassium-transporting ATPase subunit KdpA [Anaerolineae bacterium]MCB0244837.1 potassium-transporting ATPase subunit KdpA [Anaerolineae bacterium]